MIKILEKLKNNEEMKIFQDSFKVRAEMLNVEILTKIDEFAQFFNAEFVNLEEIKSEISELIKVKMTIKIPDKFVDEILTMNAQKEPKKRGRKKK